MTAHLMEGTFKGHLNFNLRASPKLKYEHVINSN